MTASTCKVVRDGVIKHIKNEDLVVGDIVILEAGDSVPADCRLIESASLKAEEAALTGESVPAEKEIDTLTAEDGKGLPPYARILAFGERGLRGEHHLEIVFLRVVLAEQMAPERHVVVALHIGHDALACRLGAQAVGCFYVERGYVLCQSFGHVLEF